MPKGIYPRKKRKAAKAPKTSRKTARKSTRKSKKSK